MLGNYRRLCLCARNVIATVEYLRIQRGLPKRIQVDNGSEYISKALDLWAYECNPPISNRNYK